MTPCVGPKRIRWAILAALLFPSIARAGAALPDVPGAVRLPRLVDLGADRCIPCKKMAPILDSLRVSYTGVVDVVFVDVWKNPRAGKPYNIRLIPTQIFFDRTGKEVLRHEGFLPRVEIERVFREKLGVKAPPARAVRRPASKAHGGAP